MGQNVFANGREISCKKDTNKSICSMPDVCLSPPSPPAGPLPIPYPNTAMASDTDEGSKSVQIGGDEVGMKNISNYKKSSGDEAATKSFGMNVISHNIQGPLKHAAWSMDVQIEGNNAIRHMDITTQNHSNPAAVPGLDVASMAPKIGGDKECQELERKARAAIREDTEDGTLPHNDALVTARTSRGKFLKAVQPGTDWVRTNKSAGYSQPHGSKRHPCGGAPYSTNSQGNKDHSECKIMHQAMGGSLTAGGAITMRVNWHTSPPGTLSDSPCSQCMGSICKTAAKCKIEIFICTGDADDMEKKKAPCKKVNHRDRPPSHRWDSGRW